MSWQNLSAVLLQEHLETVEEKLLDWGALSITLKDAQDNPILEPAPETTPLWGEIHLTALFPADTELQPVIEDISPFTQNLSEAVIEDRDWERVWLKDFGPLSFGNKSLWILPQGHRPPESGRWVSLDPGLAFGTGTHPTTALCLEWLATHDIQDQTVLDYGCGSGILAIAAKKMGAGQVIAVDIDPQATYATRINALRNDVELAVGEPADIKQSVDLLIANILYAPLVELAESFTHLLSSGGRIVLSGILTDQADSVMAAYTPDIAWQATQNQGEWSMVSGTKLA